MNSEQIKQLLVSEIPDCDIAVEGGDGKYLITATGSVFDGLNTVKRNQLVYKILNEHIASGAIHAVTMHLASPAENQS